MFPLERPGGRSRKLGVRGQSPWPLQDPGKGTSSSERPAVGPPRWDLDLVLDAGFVLSCLP